MARAFVGLTFALCVIALTGCTGAGTQSVLPPQLHSVVPQQTHAIPIRGRKRISANARNRTAFREAAF